MTKPALLQLAPYPDADNVKLDRDFEVFRLYTADDQTCYLNGVGAKIRAVAGRGELAVDRAMIQAMPNLEIISVFGAGYDGVDVAAASEAGVIVTNTPHILSGDVADLAVALFMGIERELLVADRYVRSGEWIRSGKYKLLRRNAGRKAGIVGLGRIGLEIGKRLAALEMDILYWSRTEKPCPGDWEWVNDRHELADRADALFVALAANQDTHHFVDRRMIEAVGPEGAIVNISRAATIDEQALLDCLEGGQLGRAGLDVFEGEPDIDPRFRELDNVILHPHSGSGTIESRREMGDLMLRNLVNHFQGKPPLTPVN